MKPEDIAAKTFQTGKKGYEPSEVHAFLAEVSSEVAALLQELDALRTKNSDNEQQVGQMKGRLQELERLEDRINPILERMNKASEDLIEQSKVNTALIANRADSDRKLVISQAKKEADIIVQDAEKKAQAIVSEADRKVQDFRDELGILQARRLALVSRLKSLLVSQAQFLESIEGDVLQQAREGSVSLPEADSATGVTAEHLKSILQKLEKEGE